MAELIEKGFPFDSVTDELGKPDRIFYSADFAGYFSQFISNGVYPNPSNGLSVLSLNNNMVVTVKAGSGYIKGYGYILKEDLPITINGSHVSYNRKDIIVLQLDLVNRNIRCLYKAGTASTYPVKPSLTRNDDVYELQLAEITVPNGAARIQPSDILDTRLNNSVCGIVHAVVDTADTTAIFNQYKNYLDRKIAEWDSTKTQQETDWQAQMTSQQSSFNTQKSEIQAWYDSVKADITKLQTFDFDNLAALSGAKKTTVFNYDGNITETIVINGTTKKIADRVTVFNTGGSITVTTKVYNDDGISVLTTSVVTTTFKTSGEIEEVIL